MVATSAWLLNTRQRFVVIGACAAYLAVVPVYAQEATDSASPTPALLGRQVVGQPAGPPPTPRHTGIKAMLKGLVTDVKNLPSRENLFWVGVGSGLALAAHPFDDNVNRSLV